MSLTRLADAIVVGVLAFSVANASAVAATFYTTDPTTDEFLRIDGDTGEVVSLGSLGLDLADVDMARTGDTLYLLNSHFQNFVNVFSVDLTTGLPSSASPVTRDGVPVINAEGLAFLDGRLLAAVETTEFASSSRVGELAETGEIGESVEYLGFDSAADFDAMTTDGEKLVGLDGIPPGTTRVVHAGAPDNPFFTSPGSADYVPINDVVFVESELWGVVSQVGLVRLDPSTGAVLETIAISPVRSLSGLEIADATSTPTQQVSWSELKSRHRER